METKVIEPIFTNDAREISTDTETGQCKAFKFEKRNKFGDEFRNYDNSVLQARVEENYLKQHTQMTVANVKALHKKWLSFNHGKHTIMEVLEMLDSLIDESDPDLDIPNSFHAYMTAEVIRAVYPEEEMEWFWLVGLIHDLGKVMSLWGEKQWYVVGDTYPVGCRPSSKIAFHHQFQHCEDCKDPVFSSKNGIYEEKCGIDNLLMAFGHDEYLYRVIKEHEGMKLPEIALKVIRFHSFYPWHKNGAYKRFCREEDEHTLKWVQEFSKFDLYSKGNALPDVEKLKPFYQALLEKYGIGSTLYF